jgi:hypothetical protein
MDGPLNAKFWNYVWYYILKQIFNLDGEMFCRMYNENMAAMRNFFFFFSSRLSGAYCASGDVLTEFVNII